MLAPTALQVLGGVCMCIMCPPATLLPLLTHPVTLPALSTQVLGRSEFKQLLRWRLLVKKDLQRQQQAAAKAAAAAEGAEEGGSGEDKEEEDPEEKLLREMGDIKDRCVPGCS